LPLNGFGGPRYRLTVCGRKSGQPHSTPVVIVEQEGKEYLLALFGVVNWVRNLRASGTGTFTRTHRHEEAHARELPRDEAGMVLKGLMSGGKNPPTIGYFDVTTQ
jgi:deazaflavin-dependent oxidoreductase (nitroreductase family)